MKLKLTSIREKGEAAKERIVMKVESPGNVGEYILLQAGFRDGSVTTAVFDTFWFPDKQVSSGDYVVLYTKAGQSSHKPFKDVTSHFFYWGKSSPIWGEADKSAVLMHAPTWESLQAEEDEL